MRTNSDKLFAAMILMLISAMLITNLVEDKGRNPDLVGFGGDFELFEAFTGVPDKIVLEAIASDGLAVILYGTPSEKHLFAKGYSTRFGRMGFNTDDFLKYRKGWSEQKIHDLGYLFGFSEPWDQRAP